MMDRCQVRLLDAFAIRDHLYLRDPARALGERRVQYVYLAHNDLHNNGTSFLLINFENLSVNYTLPKLDPPVHSALGEWRPNR
jgi:hypothetical protein